MFNDKVNKDIEFVEEMGKILFLQIILKLKNINEAISEILPLIENDTDLDFINEFMNVTKRNKEFCKHLKR